MQWRVSAIVREAEHFARTLVAAGAVDAEERVVPVSNKPVLVLTEIVNRSKNRRDPVGAHPVDRVVGLAVEEAVAASDQAAERVGHGELEGVKLDEGGACGMRIE